MNKTLRIAGLRMQRRLGWSGLVGVALLIASAGVTAWLPGTADLEALARRVTQAEAHAQTLRQRGPDAPRLTPQQAAADIAARLPLLRDNAADMSHIFRLAQAHRIELAKADYQLHADARGTLLAYSVTLPVQQSYAVVKQFSGELLQALPHASLDELRLERSDVGSAELDARLRLTLLYRGE